MDKTTQEKEFSGFHIFCMTASFLWPWLSKIASGVVRPWPESGGIDSKLGAIVGNNIGRRNMINSIYLLSVLELYTIGAAYSRP